MQERFIVSKPACAPPRTSVELYSTVGWYAIAGRVGVARLTVAGDHTAEPLRRVCTCSMSARDGNETSRRSCYALGSLVVWEM